MPPILEFLHLGQGIFGVSHSPNYKASAASHLCGGGEEVWPWPLLLTLASLKYKGHELDLEVNGIFFLSKISGFGPK